ncbi:threonine/serine exporter family protein [Algivirga pacifica]|uniref:Threonine/serine exporter family protein n=1 Tax=Algivirga pacifica TaxID=1162670 RepID=A0ABP9D9Z3_9BACT
MTTERLLQLATKAGRIMLENGGETYRVEQTINFICMAYGVENVDSFVTPTGIMSSVTDREGKTYSLIQRITERTVNLEKVRMVNELSRTVFEQNMTEIQMRDKIREIDDSTPYAIWSQYLMSAIAVAAFCLLFGGAWKDTIVAFFVGLLIQFNNQYLEGWGINRFLIRMSGGVIAALMGLLAVYLGLGEQDDKITIGAIMLLVPGLAMTNAIRDIIAEDLVSGMSRALEALFIALAISAGTGVVYKLWYVFS